MRKLSVIFFLLVLLSVVLLSTCDMGTVSSADDTATDGTVDLPDSDTTPRLAPPRYDLEHDMFLDHEGFLYSPTWPHWDPAKEGITAFNWYRRPNFDYLTKGLEKDGSLTNSKHPIHAGPGFNRIVAWGGVFASRERPTPNIDEETKGARVHVKDFRVFILRKDNREWYEVKLSNDLRPQLDGALYFCNFKPHENDFEGAVEKYTDNDGRVTEISLTAGASAGTPGFLNHFFWKDHPKIDPLDNQDPEQNEEPSRNIEGLYIVCQAKLIGEYTEDPRYLIRVGYDYWLDEKLVRDEVLKKKYDPHLTKEGEEVPGDGIDDGAGGRYKFVTPEWRYYHFHTFSPEEVKSIRFPGE